jgi:hypothetical protein
MASQFTVLDNSRVTSFTNLVPGSSTSPSTLSGLFQGVNPTAAQTVAIIQPLADLLQLILRNRYPVTDYGH